MPPSTLRATFPICALAMLTNYQDAFLLTLRQTKSHSLTSL
jgi:hypothetical protein